jgi:hypothetical protein
MYKTGVQNSPKSGYFWQKGGKSQSDLNHITSMNNI